MAKKVRVLQIIDKVGNAGAEVLQRTFAEGLDRTRFDLYICGLRPRPGSITVPALKALGVPVIVLNQHASYDLPSLLRLVRYIRRHKIDIIHTHLQGADIMGRMAGFATRRPVVSTIHNGLIDLDEEPRHRQLLERWTAHLWCRKLVVVSELLRAEVAQWFGFPLSRVLTIANGVDTDRFYRRPDFDRAAVKQALVGGDFPLVTNLARLTPQKGQEYLVKAARIVTLSRPDVRFAVLGEGPLLGDLQEQAVELGVADNFVFAGFRDNVPDILAASDLFVLSSLWEGMPVALLEAMSAGCATVSTDVGGVAQVVRDGVTGLLVPPADAETLALSILRCINDPGLSRRLGEAARAEVVRNYSMRAWVSKWEDLYLHELGIRLASRAEDA